MPDERDISDLQLYGAEDFEELDAIETAIEAALELDHLSGVSRRPRRKT